MKLHSENLIGKTIQPNLLVTRWMIEYTAETIDRYGRQQEGRPEEASLGKLELRKMAEFGDSSLWLPETWKQRPALAA